MIISSKTQLGLRLNELDTQVKFLTCLQKDLQWQVGAIDKIIPRIKNNEIEMDDEKEKNLITLLVQPYDVIANIKERIGEQNCVDGSRSSYYFICDSVYKAAELIKVNEGFTGRTLKDLKDGKYTYLMGRSRCIRFTVSNGALLGFYYDDSKNYAFEYGVNLESGVYYFSPQYQTEYTAFMQIMIFVQLGDIEVKLLESGRNNGLPKKEGKITNDSKNTVYVVDSTWNQIIIRTDGFGVRGHFRLQACGPGLADRKLIWINAFEKHGWHRRPKGEIVD